MDLSPSLLIKHIQKYRSNIRSAFPSCQEELKNQSEAPYPASPRMLSGKVGSFRHCHFPACPIGTLSAQKMFIDQNPLIIKISEIEQFIIPKEIGFCPIHIIRKRLPDSFFLPRRSQYQTVFQGSGHARIHTAPDIKKMCLYSPRSECSEGSVWTRNNKRKRLRSLIKCQLFPD